MWRAAADRVQNRTAVPSKILLRRAVIHELIDWQVQDLLQASVDRMAQSPHKDLQDAKNTEFIILQSVELSKQKQELEGFLFNHVYQHPNVLAVRDHAQSALHEMFDKLVRHIEFLPESYRRRAEESNARRSVCDYLAGMTDRFAWREHQRLCGP